MDLARWCREMDQETKLVLDSHYDGLPLGQTDDKLGIDIGLDMHRLAAEALPNFNLRLWPLEENGQTYNWERGLGHAHNLNMMNRMPSALERAATANAFQAWDLFLAWSQGRIQFTPSKIICEPPYYVDRMFADEWLPLVVQAECAAKTLDVLAKKSSDGKTLTLYLVNIAEAPVTASFSLLNFAPQNAKATRIQAGLTATNTPDQPFAVVPQAVPWNWNKTRLQMELPAYSFTTLRLSQ